jgi:hypothetical protein
MAGMEQYEQKKDIFNRKWFHPDGNDRCADDYRPVDIKWDQLLQRLY